MRLNFGEIPDEKNKDFYLLLRRIILEKIGREKRSAAIAIGGDKCTGKTSLSQNMVKFLGEENSVAVALDDYMISRQERAARGITGFYPEAFDLELAKENISGLLQGREIEKPVYDHSTGLSYRKERVQPKGIVVVNGSMALQPILVELYQARYFVEIPLERESGRPWNFEERVERDVKERGYTRERAETLWQEDRRVYESFVLPTKASADAVYEVLPGYVLRLTEANPWVRKLI